MLIKSTIFITAFLIGVIITAVIKKYSLRKNMLIDKGISLAGGLGLGLSFIAICLIACFALGCPRAKLVGILSASGVMLLFGLLDDFKELSIAQKFLTQVFAVFVLIFFGLRTHIVYIGVLANIIITLIWMLGIINAFNHLDVMDGLAGIVAIVISFTFFAFAVFTHNSNVMILSLALSGALAGFLIYNMPPAKVYMGNCGSHFLGFVLAITAIEISYAPLNRKIALFSPIIILGFPIFDMVFLMWMRIKKKRSVFKKSDDHLALVFLKLGYSKTKILSLVFLLCLFFSACAILLTGLL